MDDQEPLETLFAKLCKSQASRDGELERVRLNNAMAYRIERICRDVGIPEREWPTVLAIVLAHETERLLRKILRLSAMTPVTLVMPPPSAPQP